MIRIGFSEEQISDLNDDRPIPPTKKALMTMNEPSILHNYLLFLY